MFDSIAYLNGEWTPLRDARIPVLDRGFLFGDGIYDALIAYSGIPFHAEAHLARLDSSLRKISLRNPFTVPEWIALISDLIRKNHQQQHHSIFMEITRGTWNGRMAFAEDAQPTVFMMSLPYAPPDAKLLKQGISAVTAADVRSQHRDIKSTSMLGNLLARQLAISSHAEEVILFRDGYLTEGTSSNILAVIDGEICVPPKSNLSLPGVTCDIALELASQQGIPVSVRPLSKAEVEQADEIWLTSTLRQVQAITQLDGRAVGAGTPGPLFERIAQAFENEKIRLFHAK